MVVVWKGKDDDMKAKVSCHDPSTSRRGWARRGIRGLLFTALAVLMPKCPICIAAWLGALGLSGLAARVDPRVLWLAGALTIALLAAPLLHRVLWFLDQRRAAPVTKTSSIEHER